MILALEIAGLLSIITLTGIAIAALVIFMKLFSQIKYQNYLLSKLTHLAGNKNNTINSNFCQTYTEDYIAEDSEIANMQEQSSIPHIIK